MLIWAWQAYDIDRAIAIEEDWFMLSFAYKWLGEDRVHVKTLEDYPGYKRNKKCDRALVKDLHALFSEADILVSHNGDRHDISKGYARFVYHKLDPPSEAKSIDTYKAAKRYCKFSSNSLDHLSAHFDIGRKLPNTGFDLWQRCRAGDSAAWDMMRQYNAHDVDPLLEGVYLRLRPYIKNHPRLSLYTRDFDACPVCQSKQIVHKGWHFMQLGKKQRHKCNSCGHRFVAGPIIRDK